MNTTPETTAMVLGALGRGLPMLLLQFGVCLSLLVVGVLIYLAVTPFREQDLLRSGNAAAATVLGGTLFALAIPLAALLAHDRGIARPCCVGRRRRDPAAGDGDCRIAAAARHAADD